MNKTRKVILEAIEKERENVIKIQTEHWKKNNHCKKKPCSWTMTLLGEYTMAVLLAKRFRRIKL